jgi:hypothetical protein
MKVRTDAVQWYVSKIGWMFTQTAVLLSALLILGFIIISDTYAATVCNTPHLVNTTFQEQVKWNLYRD